MILSEPGGLNLSDIANLPTAIDKRDILFGVRKVTPDQLKSYAERMEAAGWINDAVDFWAQLKDTPNLKRIQNGTTEEGDTFLFLKISKILGDIEESLPALQKCSEKAESLGKFRYAIRGFERLGDTSRVESIRTRIAGDGDIVATAQQHVFIPDAEVEPDEEN